MVAEIVCQRSGRLEGMNECSCGSCGCERTDEFALSDDCEITTQVNRKVGPIESVTVTIPIRIASLIGFIGLPYDASPEMKLLRQVIMEALNDG